MPCFYSAPTASMLLRRFFTPWHLPKERHPLRCNWGILFDDSRVERLVFIALW